MKKILYVPHPILRQKSLDLKSIEKEDLLLAEEMMDIMMRALVLVSQLIKLEF